MTLRGFSGWVVTFSAVISGALTLEGCNLGKGYADFGDDLANPEQTVIDGPGKKIADGRISGMLVDPWGDHGAVVVGFRYQDDGPHLVMQPFDGSKSCDVGLAYRCIVFNRLEGEPQLIAYLTDIKDNGRGTLNFVGHDCKLAYGGIKDAELPSRLFEFPPGVVVAAGDRLLNVDPFEKTTSVMTENLRFWSGPGQKDQVVPHYYVGDGTLVVFDDERQDLIRLGKDVTEVVFEGTDYNKGLFLVDGGTLVRYWSSSVTLSEDNVQTETLDSDVCGANIGTFGISYFSPCADHTLVVSDLDAGTKETIDVGVNRIVYGQKRPRADGTGTDIEVVYVKPSTEDPGFEDLWLKQAGQAPRLWQHRLGQFLSATTGDKPTLTAVVDSDKTTGRLITVGSDGEKTLHPKVLLGYPIESHSNAWLVMTDFVDGMGTLTLVGADGKATIIAEKVPLNSKIVSPERDPYLDGVKNEDYYELAAVVSNVEGDVGELGMMTRAKPKTLATLAEQVHVGDFRFFQNMAALGYLDEFDEKTGTGRLVVHETTLGAPSIVSKNVLEFSELLWPWEGVIYTVKDGEDYSLWAARAK
jgi:hypothetical protein